MKPKLIILGTNEYQNPLILRAKELGYETHSYGIKSGQIGEFTADFYHPINIMDFDALWDDCKKLGAVGVGLIASEPGMHAQHFLLRKMGIPCNSEWTEEATTNKYLMRTAIKEAGLDSPNFMMVTKDMTIKDILSQITNYHYPLIVKPVDSTSSMGVYKINEEKDFPEAIEYAMNASKSKRIMLEEFIEGPEYSGDSIAYEGKYKLLAITEKHTTGAPHFVETGHKQPAALSSEMYKRVEETLYKAFASLKIEYGAVHPEFRITPDGRILFMEIASRMGGDCIGSDLVQISTGYDYMGMVINIGCGKAPSFEKISVPRIAEIHYIINQADLDEYNRVKREEPEIIWRESEMNPISDKPILKSADRAGYYITAKPIK